MTCFFNLQNEGDIFKTSDEPYVTVNEIRNSSEACDIDNSSFIDGTNPYMSMIIQIGSDRLFASKEVLALSSPVLREKIDAIHTDPVTLEFPDCNRDDFLCLLRSVHPNIEPTVNSNECCFVTFLFLFFVLLLFR